MARLSLIFAVVCLVGGAAACTTAALKSAPAPAPTDPAVDEGPPPEENVDAGDASNNTGNTNKSDAATPVDSGPPGPCVPKAKITLANIPTGYLAPVKVTISALADGDSGRYNFPNALDQGVRMLYVNTEESFGAEMTEFGVQTKAKVHPWIRAATNIQIVVRESSPGSGLPDNDPYMRWLSLVFLDGELLQERLVREGLSAYYTQFGCAPAASPLHEALLYGEAEANAADRGIWGPGPHNNYESVLAQWIGSRTCRPNPFKGQAYCPAK